MTRERPKHPDLVEAHKLREGLEEHEGIPHDPAEFDPLNPARQGLSGNADRTAARSRDGDDQPLRQGDDIEREPRLHKDQTVSPGGNKPDTAMCEKKGEPGMVNKDKDC